MKRIALCLGALLVLAVVPSSGAAQKLEAGKWSGTVTPPDGSATEVVFDVLVRSDTISISVNAGQHGTYPFQEVKLVDKTLTFWFTPGPRVDCTLSRRDDGAFAGQCRDPQGGIAQMLMMPPKKG